MTEENKKDDEIVERENIIRLENLLKNAIENRRRISIENKSTSSVKAKDLKLELEA